MRKTIFDDVEPLTPEERTQFAEEHRKEWFYRTLGALLGVASYDQGLANDQGLAKSLCERIADHYGRDDELRPMMIARLKENAIGKKRGQKPDKVRYIVLLTHYYFLRQSMGRSEALWHLAQTEDVTELQIERRITKARKIVSPSDLPEDVVSVLTPPNKSK